MKKLLNGIKKNPVLKFVAILLAFSLASLFLPFVIGAGLIYLANKRVSDEATKFAVMGVVAVLACAIGFPWSAGFLGLSDTTPRPVQTSAPTVTGSTAVTTAASPSSSVAETPSTTSSYEVLSVVDGDTIKVSIDGKTETLRLIGLDSPETVDPRKPVQCFGKEASEKMKSLVSGKRVILEAEASQGERDKYDRLLRYAFLEDGIHVNKTMVLEGYAHEYTYNIPYKYQEEFKNAERDAAANKRGLWADGACEPVATSAPTQSTEAVIAPPSGDNCDPNYTPCIPKYPPDLDCGDIDQTVTVIGSDPHKFDKDKDGYGCE